MYGASNSLVCMDSELSHSLISTKKKQFSTEQWAVWMLRIAACISIVITLLILASVLFESLRFFTKVPVAEFLFGTHWSPQTSLRADQAGSSGSFGILPVISGTLMITFIAMCVAVPLGLMAAIYLAEYASSNARNKIKPVLEILAGIPTVVYGYFAVIAVAPLLRDIGGWLTTVFAFLASQGLTFLDGVTVNVASESALNAGLVMGVMIIPFILSLSDDVIFSVPKYLRDGSLALGATKSETIKRVILPTALPGIISAVLLGISRAIGETMIVVMAAGLAANLTLNPLEPVTTVTVQIVTLLVGDQEFDSAKTLAAFALGLVLFLLTLFLNVISLVIIKRYKRMYGAQ